MAPSTPRSLIRLSATSFTGISLCGLWLWWFMTGGGHIRLVPIIEDQGISVTIPQGTYIGFDATSDYPQTLEQFLGIPYAQSTAEERRFMPPLALGASRGTFYATKYGDRCPAGAPDGVPQTEDCLNLNIYRPKERVKGRLLPVLIHIHGGSFNFGFGHNRAIANMVGWSLEPFIGVSFNYRLGAFGFLPSNLTAGEGLLNVGLKDQAALFKWVQKNIAAFGGNPNDVTVMGSSAGAHSVGHHLLRNLDSPPLFHKAIMESGATTARAVYPAAHPLHEEQFEEFISKLGLSSFPKDQLISKLREQDMLTIKMASEAIYDKYNPSIRWAFQPVIDGEGGIIPIPPVDAWESGKWTKIPILTGFNTNEGSMFVPKSPSTSTDFTSFFHTLLPSLSDHDLETLDKTYPDPLTHPESKYVETRPGVNVGAQYKRMEQAYAQFAYIAPVRQTARYASKYSAPVYLYHFAVNGSIIEGANHGDQNPYSTYNKDLREKSETLGEVSGSMHAYWTSFITRGDPNAVRGRFPDRPEWPAYTTDEPKMVIFGEGNDERTGGGSKGTAVKVTDNSWALEECQYWWKRTMLFESWAGNSVVDNM